MLKKIPLDKYYLKQKGCIPFCRFYILSEKKKLKLHL